MDDDRAPHPRLQAGGVQARTRHSLPGRLARAARAALQSHLSPLKATRIPLGTERATGLFRSGALESHISRALGNTLGPDGGNSKGTWNFFSAGKKLPDAHPRISREDWGREMQLSGKHSLGAKTTVETILQGTKVSLLEFQLRLVHSLVHLQHSDQAVPKEDGCIALTGRTDLHAHHRLTLESTMGSEEDKHSISTVFSSDFLSRFSWGLASSHKVDHKLTLYSRYTSDKNAGQRLILQAVHRLDERNSVSPICAATTGSRPQAGVSWTHFFALNGVGEESLQLKALCAGNGAYVLSLKAQVGKVEL